jgi:hypothetical protein
MKLRPTRQAKPLHQPTMTQANRNWTTLAALLLVLCARGAAGQPPLATRSLENSQYRYSVALPQGCRLEEGPGTLDAICAPQFDAQKSAEASAAASLILEVAVEVVPADANKPIGDLAQSYPERAFKQELPEAICGEEDASRVKIDNLKRVLDENRVVYSADVGCAEVRFLGVGARRAAARTYIMPGMRYHLFARALKDDFETHKQIVDAFFASFVVMAEEKTNA